MKTLNHPKDPQCSHVHHLELEKISFKQLSCKFKRKNEQHHTFRSSSICLSLSGSAVLPFNRFFSAGFPEPCGVATFRGGGVFCLGTVLLARGVTASSALWKEIVMKKILQHVTLNRFSFFYSQTSRNLCKQVSGCVSIVAWGTVSVLYIRQRYYTFILSKHGHVWKPFYVAKKPFDLSESSVRFHIPAIQQAMTPSYL